MFICDICGKEFKKRGNHPLTHLPNGFVPWNKGGGDYRPESLAKMSASQKTRFRRMPTPNKGVPHTKMTKEKISQKLTGHKMHFLDKQKRQEWINRRSEAMKGKPKPPHIQKILAKNRARILADPILREKMSRNALQALRKRPTSLEKEFMALCGKHSLPYRYVGNGEIWIGRMNPDFINIDGKKQLVEVLGSYWHNKKETDERIRKYAKYGFECIAIWEDELKDEELVLARLGVKC